MNIVILHGWGLCGKTYESLLEVLEKKSYRVFAPDLPGFGASKKPKKAWGLDNYADFVKNFVDKQRIKKFILVGHSFGGRVAIRFAELYPSKIAKLVLTGVPGTLPASRSKINFFLVLAKIGRILFSLSLFSSFKDSARKILYKFAKASDYYQAEGVMRTIFLNVIRTDLEKSMGKIKSPTLLVWGKKDVIVSPLIGQKMKTLIANSAYLEIPNTGHRLPYKQPELFVKYANL